MIRIVLTNFSENASNNPISYSVNKLVLSKNHNIGCGGRNGMKKLLITLLLFFSSLTNAGVYKWTDENGNVHYGDKPTTSSEQLNISTEKSTRSSMTDEAREERRQRISDSLTDDRLERNKKKAEAKKKKAKLNSQCVYAKDRLKRYQRAGRLYNLDKEGNRVTLSDKSRDKTIASLQKEIRKNCK